MISAALLVLACLLLLGFAGRRLRAAERRPLADRIDAVLPQTQCGQCGYASCRPYAEALAAGKADINQCPPGGEAGIRMLARLLHTPPKPLDKSHGVYKEPAVARIDEQACIGCTLCIQACPVDAILGAAKQMHTVIEAECTGCELCLPPCPVDCIEMLPVVLPSGGPIARRVQQRRRADLARHRYQARTHRLEAEQRERSERRARKQTPPAAPSGEDPRKAAIRAAVERTRTRKEALRRGAAQEHDGG